MTEKIKKVIVEDQLKEAYLDYSMSVIVGRALPDVRDGLKPVHRRILFAMNEIGLQNNKQFKKCARIVGEVLGKFHPHGDTAVYDALVRLAQDFNLRYPLVHGQGNFGSVDGFPAAAARYTEAKLSKIAQELLDDLDKNTVKFIPNFDNLLKEPVVLPSKIPNLLLNGSTGIAVGMATNMPPHNLNEICNLTINLIDNEELELNEILNLIKGPDFPTGAYILGTNGIKQAYKTGKGKIVLRAKAFIENGRIIISEIPYQVNKSALIIHIADLVKDKVVEGITDIRDESNKEGMRIVIEVRKNADATLILNQLYKNSSLQTSFGIIMLALVDGQPRVLNIKEIIQEFIKHRKGVVTKRTQFDLNKAEERDHVLQGLLIALASIDEVIKLIKSSNDIDDARKGLILNYHLDETQSNAILEMKLSKLAALEQEKILKEHEQLVNYIKELKEILVSKDRIKKIIKDELIDIKNRFGDERRTQIIELEEQIEDEDLIENEEVVITLTHKGYIKRVPLNTYTVQKRGGKGIIGTTAKEEDFVEDLFITNSHSYLLFFTNKGTVHWLKAFQVPEIGRYSKGTPIVNFIKLNDNEKISAVVPVNNFEENRFLTMFTKKGLVKKTSLKEYSRPRLGGIIGINLKENDELVSVKLTDNTKQLVIATNDGRAVRFKESNVSIVGRNSMGVKGIKVNDSDVIGADVINAPYLLTVTENGYGKRTLIEEYRLINRGGSGVTNIKITEKNGKVVGIKIVNDLDELMFITKQGMIIRTPVKDISIIGRNTQGVRMMKLNENDKIVSVAIIANDEKPEEFKPSDLDVEIDLIDSYKFKKEDPQNDQKKDFTLDGYKEDED